MTRHYISPWWFLVDILVLVPSDHSHNLFLLISHFLSYSDISERFSFFYISQMHQTKIPRCRKCCQWINEIYYGSSTVIVFLQQSRSNPNNSGRSIILVKLSDWRFKRHHNLKQIIFHLKSNLNSYPVETESEEHLLPV